MLAISKKVGEDLKEIEIENTLEATQEFVDGYIEVISVTTDYGIFLIICNEEGRLRGMPKNCTIDRIDFVGDILICGEDGEDFGDCPLTIDQLKEFIKEV